jgi:hypothetical protein
MKIEYRFTKQEWDGSFLRDLEELATFQNDNILYEGTDQFKPCFATNHIHHEMIAGYSLLEGVEIRLDPWQPHEAGKTVELRVVT